MRREEVIEYVNEQLDAAGVPTHVRSVRKVPAQVAVDVVMGSGKETLMLRTGITLAELKSNVANLCAKWGLGGRQVDLEDAIAATKAADVIG